MENLYTSLKDTRAGFRLLRSPPTVCMLPVLAMTIVYECGILSQEPVLKS